MSSVYLPQNLCFQKYESNAIVSIFSTKQFANKGLKGAPMGKLFTCSKKKPSELKKITEHVAQPNQIHNYTDFQNCFTTN